MIIEDKCKCGSCNIETCDKCTGCENVGCNNFITCECPKCEWATDALKMSKKELEEEIDNYNYYIRFLRELKHNKTITEFDWSGKYIKVYETSEEEAEYINCEFCRLDNSQMHAEPHIYFKGVGFHSCFGPYEDSNFIYFSTRDDHYLNYRFWEEYEERRQSGNIKPSDRQRNCYKVEIITKEEYENAFNKMINNLKDCFNQWKEPYENRES